MSVNHHSETYRCSAIAITKSNVPFSTKKKPKRPARIENVWNGDVSAAIPPTMNSTPRMTCTHVHPLPHSDRDELADTGEDQPDGNHVADEQGRVEVRFEHPQTDRDPQEAGYQQQPPQVAGLGRVGCAMPTVVMVTSKPLKRCRHNRSGRELVLSRFGTKAESLPRVHHGGMSGTGEARKIGLRRRGEYRFGLVLILLLATFVFLMAGSTASWTRPVGVALSGATLVASLSAADVSPRLLRCRDAGRSGGVPRHALSRRVGRFR